MLSRNRQRWTKLIEFLSKLLCHSSFIDTWFLSRTYDNASKRTLKYQHTLKYVNRGPQLSHKSVCLKYKVVVKCFFADSMTTLVQLQQNELESSNRKVHFSICENLFIFILGRFQLLLKKLWSCKLSFYPCFWDHW